MSELREVVEQYVSLGYESPEAVVDAVLASRGEAWVRERVDVTLVLRQIATGIFVAKRYKADIDRRKAEEEKQKAAYQRTLQESREASREYKRIHGKSRWAAENERRQARKEWESARKRELGLPDDASGIDFLAAAMKEYTEQAVQEGINDFLSSLLVKHHVPGEDGGVWKKRADLTPDDCDQISEAYMGRAETELQEGVFFESLAKKMRDEGAERVADLVPVPA